MIYITGDTHGDFSRFERFCETVNPSAESDVMIILGDAGLNYYSSLKDIKNKARVAEFPLTFFCIHGNHERRPGTIGSYTTKEYRGGSVWYEEQFPNILFAKDGDIYNFDGNECIVIGGAYSVDKYYRVARNWPWFADEQPSKEIKDYVESQLLARDNTIDVVLSHTCPLRYEPVEMFLPGVDQSTVDASTEEWLGNIEGNLAYKKWYCGHYHTSKKVDRIQFMFEDIEEFCV